MHDASAGAAESGAHGDVSAAAEEVSPQPDGELPPPAGEEELPRQGAESQQPAGEGEPPPPGGVAAEAEHGNIPLRSRRKRKELQPVQALSEGMF